MKKNFWKFSFIMCCVLSSAKAEMPDQQIKTLLLTKDHGTELDNVLTNAFDQGRRDLLIVGLDNPNFWVKTKVAIMICNLPVPDKDNSFIAVLQKDIIWEEQFDGSRNVTMQIGFINKFRNLVTGSGLGVDIGNVNLFDKEQRLSLITNIRSKKPRDP